MFDKLKTFVLPVYPILFGLYPVIYLWNANKAQEPAYVIVPSLLYTLAGLAVLFLLTLAIFRSLHRAALVTALLSLYLLAYGHFANPIIERNPGIDPTSILLVSALMVLFIILLVAVRRWGSPTLSKAINLVSAGLVMFQIVSAVPYYLSVAQSQRVAAARAERAASVNPIPVTGSRPMRDVYFILIDNYGRQDILAHGSDFDNSEMVNALKERGFLFPDCAQGNYFHTAPSVASILNMDYLDALQIEESAYVKRGGYGKMAPMIQDSEVLGKFKEYGYHTVTFRGFMGLIDIPNSDTYISYDQDKAYTQRIETTKFQDLYWRTTILPKINEQFKIYPDWVAQQESPFFKQLLPAEQPLEPKFYNEYLQNLYAFDALERIPIEIERPKFVYAHIYTAHWPFMLQPDGSMRLPFTEKQTVEGYIDGVHYTNNRILKAIDSILENSETPPVIILQGDHSNEWERPVEWSGKDRLKILSAYYLPDGGDELLYDTISPVNNFRLIFKHYFGEPLDLLPDAHYYLDRKTRQVTSADVTCMSGVVP